jgi:hypothetical protein
MSTPTVTLGSAFVVEFAFTEPVESLLGPDGWATRIACALLGSGEKPAVEDIHREWKAGRVRYVFREEDRAEVTKRFAALGLGLGAARVTGSCNRHDDCAAAGGARVKHCVDPDCHGTCYPEGV